MKEGIILRQAGLLLVDKGNARYWVPFNAMETTRHLVFLTGDTKAMKNFSLILGLKSGRTIEIAARWPENDLKNDYVVADIIYALTGDVYADHGRSGGFKDGRVYCKLLVDFINPNRGIAK